METARDRNASPGGASTTVCLQGKGLQGFTLRACARRAGVSHTAPQHHFKDVRGLLSGVAERGFQRLVDMLQKRLAEAAGDLDDEMYATAVAYADFAMGNPEHFRIMFRSDLLGFDPAAPPRSVVDTFTELTNVILRQRGEAEIDTPAIHVEPPQQAINDIIIGWSHVHGYAHLRVEGQLGMISESDHQEQMRTASRRLARLLQSQATPQSTPARPR